MSTFTLQGRTINLGVIGLGGRGLPQLKLLAQMPDVSILAICDLYEDRVNKGLEALKGSASEGALGFRDAEAMLDLDGLEAVIIMTSWESHIPLALAALQRFIVPAMEVGGANSLRECWQLVEDSQLKNVPVMMLENCCYGREELAVQNMARQGLFGELVHCRGAYEHDLREEIGRGDLDRHYRQRHFLNRNAELYPSHALGPIAKLLGINRGNRFVSLVSVASRAAGLNAWLREHRGDRPDLQTARVNEGDVVNTLITCAGGQTILLTHDCTLPRPYSRGGRVQGTKGIWMEDNRSIYIDGRTKQVPGYWTHSWESDKPYMEEFEHPLWRDYLAFGERGGHGGMDYLVLRAFIEALQRGEPFNYPPLPIDVYDTAAWMCITALSEESIQKGGAPVAIPDFTSGMWLSGREKAAGKYALDL